MILREMKGGVTVEITEVFKKYMEDNKLSYAAVAQKIGWSKENLWYKLNVATSCTFNSIKKIADALGFDIKLEKEKTVNIDSLESLVAGVADDTASFKVVEHIMKSMGYSFKIIFPKGENEDEEI